MWVLLIKLEKELHLDAQWFLEIHFGFFGLILSSKDQYHSLQRDVILCSETQVTTN